MLGRISYSWTLYPGSDHIVLCCSLNMSEPESQSVQGWDGRQTKLCTVEKLNVKNNKYTNNNLHPSHTLRMYSEICCPHMSHRFFLLSIRAYWILKLPSMLWMSLLESLKKSRKSTKNLSLVLIVSYCDVWKLDRTWLQQHDQQQLRVRIIQCAHCVVQDRNSGWEILINVKKKRG